MARIVKKRLKLDEPGTDDKKLIRIGRIDRSHYPKHTFWIIFAAAGAVLLWLIMKFFFIMIK